MVSISIGNVFEIAIITPVKGEGDMYFKNTPYLVEAGLKVGFWENPPNSQKLTEKPASTNKEVCFKWVLKVEFVEKYGCKRLIF